MLVPLLRALGERVDTVMLSHRDSDHIGGAPAVLAMQPQATLLSSIEDGHPLQALRPVARAARPASAGNGTASTSRCCIRWRPTTRRANKPNAMSCVLRISNGAQTALLAGDIERPQEAALVARCAPTCSADVLLVPHHGSKTSSQRGVSGCRAAAHGAGAGRLPQPLRPSGAAGAGALSRSAASRVVDSPHCGAATLAQQRPGRRGLPARGQACATGTTACLEAVDAHRAAQVAFGPELAKLVQGDWSSHAQIRRDVRRSCRYSTAPRSASHYQRYDQWLAKQPGDVMRPRREEAEMIFRRVGITFAVYGAKDEDGAGTERLIPFDLIPRIIPAHEWAEHGTGLVQRVTALNRFIHDVYHDQEIIKAGVDPGRADPRTTRSSAPR